jgi:hypothetical protein
MNYLAIAVGIISLIASLVLFILERATPRNERVPVYPFFTHSHEWCRMNVIFLLIISMIFIMIGLVL